MAEDLHLEVDPDRPISAEHPIVGVLRTEPAPRRGRGWFAFGWAALGIAALIAAIGIAKPLNDYFAEQHRADQELDCRNRILQAKDEAEGQLTVDLAVGLANVVRRDDNAELLATLDADSARVTELSSLRGQANTICHDDPSFTPPATPSSP